MKPRNFPARKLRRKMVADRDMAEPWTDEELAKLDRARAIRTKKYRGSQA